MTPQFSSPPSSSNTTKNVALGALGLTALAAVVGSWRLSIAEDRQQIAQLVIEGRLEEESHQIAKPRMERSEASQTHSFSMGESERTEAPISNKEVSPYSLSVFDNLEIPPQRDETTPTNFGMAAYSLLIGGEINQQAPDLKDEVRGMLKLPLTDEAIQRGLTKLTPLLDGVIKDMGIAPNQAEKDAVMARVFADYKLTEAFIEARSRWGVSTLAELKALPAESWTILSEFVESRNSIQRAEMGMTLSPQFITFIQQLFILRGNQNGPVLPWMQK